MEQFQEHLRDMKENIKNDCIDLTFRNLTEILTFLSNKFDFPKIIDYHNRNSEDILRAIGSSFTSQKVIGETFNKTHILVKHENNFQDFPAILNYCSFVVFLLEDYPVKIGNDGIEEDLLLMLDRLIQLLLNSFEDQALVIRRAFIKIIEYFKTLNLGNSRIIFLELPIGNSIPIQLLKLMLQNEGIRCDTIIVSLSRNDKAKLKIKRIDLIKEKFQEYHFKDFDILVYIDEWFSGRNFEVICELIEKIIPKKVTFYPFALISESSKEMKEYVTRSKKHDINLRKVGLDGEHYRFIIPKIKTHFKLINKEQFFWSEYDRLAGYRKMQLMGSIVSSVNSALTVLSEDNEIFELVRKTLLLEALEKNDIKKEIWNDSIQTKKLFLESYEDYKSILPEIENIKDESNIGKVVDIDKDIENLVNKILDITDKRKAKICLTFAITFLLNLGGINAVDRYYFSHHVPLITKLEGKALLLNQKFIEFFQKKYLKNLIGENSF